MGEGVGVVGLLTFEAGWGVVRNRESRVFRSPDVGISAIANSKRGAVSFLSFLKVLSIFQTLRYTG